MTEEERDRLLAGATTIIARWETWSKRLAKHVADPSGRCIACYESAHIVTRWPCLLASIAAAVREKQSTSAPGQNHGSNASPTDQLPSLERQHPVILHHRTSGAVTALPAGGIA
ncbi:MAG: hypothetical protein ACR2GH_00500 [Pseudonocardia sp.]